MASLFHGLVACLPWGTLAAAGTVDSLAEAARVESAGRHSFQLGQMDQALVLFQSALKHLNASKAERASKKDSGTSGPSFKQLHTSARLHLGTIHREKENWDKCIKEFKIAYKDKNSFTVLKSISNDDPAIMSETMRYMVNSYAKCMYRTGKDEAARPVYEKATEAGVFRHPFQCTRGLSPAEWKLKTQPWWNLEEREGAEKICSSLGGNLAAIQAEAEEVLVRRSPPPGVNIQLNQEVNLARGPGAWLELILFREGHWVPSACNAVPELCKIMKSFRKIIHPKGHVKLSHVTGGASGEPHCGPMDTKLRLHFMVLMGPARRAELVVAGEPRSWVVGKCLMFDDSFQHTIAFDAERDVNRVVLIVDVWHPDVPKKHMDEL